VTRFESDLRVAEAALKAAQQHAPDDIDPFTKFRVSHALKKTRAVLKDLELRRRSIKTIRVQGDVL